MYSYSFKIDNIWYKFEVQNDGQISFYAVNGFKVDWTEDVSEKAYEDLNNAKNAIKVFRKIGECLIDYVNVMNPHYFYFTAATNQRKNIYDWFAHKLIRKFDSKYQLFKTDKIFEFVKVQ